MLISEAKSFSNHVVDYRIYRKKADLDSTAYIEIGPGKYSGQHWQDDFLFVSEDAFGMAEGIVRKHSPEYDHFSMNDIPRTAGQKVITEWRDVAGKIKNMNPDEIRAALNLNASYRDYLEAQVLSHSDEIVYMLSELAERCDDFYERENWVCILGM